MKRGRIGRRIVITFLKLMVLMIIIVLLAATAIPLYTGYVERARITEATSIMGAIIVSQKVEKQRAGKYYSASTVAEFKSRGIDITDTMFFTYETAPIRVELYDTFTVTATPTDAFGAAVSPITFTHNPSPGSWATDGEPILPDMLLLQS